MFSLILRPPPAPAPPALISLVAGLAVVRGLRDAVGRPVAGVKWPNDIYAGHRKLGGILIETAGMAFFVVGVGLNVNTSFRGAPEPLKARAISLRELTGRRWGEKKILTAVTRRLLSAAALFFQKGFDPFIEEWRRNDIVQIGSDIVLEDGRRTIRGRYEGILPNGAIQITDAQGLRRTAVSGTLLVKNLQRASFP